MIAQRTLFDFPIEERASQPAGIVTVEQDGRPIAHLRIPEPRRARPQKLPLSERDRERLAAVEDLKTILRPKILLLAEVTKDHEHNPGVTADDVELLLEAEPKTALLGSQQRARSWIGPWLAGLAKLKLLRAYRIGGQLVKRRSRNRRRRNSHVVYLDPSDHRASS
jgi:hypothetical protein